MAHDFDIKNVYLNLNVNGWNKLTRFFRSPGSWSYIYLSYFSFFFSWGRSKYYNNILTRGSLYYDPQVTFQAGQNII